MLSGKKVLLNVNGSKNDFSEKNCIFFLFIRR